jgi:hypothetical protein
MHKLSVTESYRRVLSSALWIAFATFVVLGLSAGMASADQGHKIDICHNGHIISVDVHAVPAHLEHGDLLGDCDGTTPCACGQNFDPVTCTLPDGSVRTFANACLAACAGATPGDCPRLGICSQIYDPVTCNGTVYANLCQALNAGCTVAQVLCPCGSIYLPVRCSDGRVYVNACVAQCQGQSGCAPF